MLYDYVIHCNSLSLHVLHVLHSEGRHARLLPLGVRLAVDVFRLVHPATCRAFMAGTTSPLGRPKDERLCLVSRHLCLCFTPQGR